jgi:uncharacterized protein
MTEGRASIQAQMRAVAQVVSDAGGEIVGRTRLQKTMFLLGLAGFQDQFRFAYKHYGPFSEALADATELAVAFDEIAERQRPASWGGTYSVYSGKADERSPQDGRAQLARESARSDAMLLELAATAGYLWKEEGKKTPWAETARRKPDKSADGRLDRAKSLYQRLRKISKDALPEIPMA